MQDQLHAVETEAGVLASLMVHPDRIAVCGLSPDDFWLESHRRVFLRLLRMHAKGWEIRPSSVAKLLARSDANELVAGILCHYDSRGFESRFAILSELSRMRQEARSQEV